MLYMILSVLLCLLLSAA